jgi:hypothetical protein
MQACDEMRARRGVRPGEHRADGVEERGVLCNVPERVCGENDYGALGTSSSIQESAERRL